MSAVEDIIEIWTDLNKPRVLPASMFATIDKMAAKRARDELRITTFQSEGRWYWEMDELVDAEEEAEAEVVGAVETEETVEAQPEPPPREDATRAWQRSMSVGGPSPLDTPSPYAPPHGPVPPTASLGHDVSWVNADRNSYTEAPDGKKYPNRFQDW